MYILDPEALYSALAMRGLNSITDLAKFLGVHRNSVARYVYGSPALPEVLQRILDTLGLTPEQALKKAPPVKLAIDKLLAPVVSKIVCAYPEVGVVLFGSRARGDARTYSDIDLGILKQKPLTLTEWSGIKDIVEKEAEDFPFMVDVVDLSRADKIFHDAVMKDLRFLGGNPLPVNLFQSAT